jgi:hypothetical protein
VALYGIEFAKIVQPISSRGGNPAICSPEDGQAARLSAAIYDATLNLSHT